MPTRDVRRGSAALVVAGKDIGQRIRDRSALLAGVVMPLVLAFVMSLAFGRSDNGFKATYAVSGASNGEMADALVSVLRDPSLKGALTVKEVASADEARRLARKGDVAAAFVIPEGYAPGTPGAPQTLVVVRGAASTVGADVAESIARSFVAQVEAVRLSVQAAIAAGARASDTPKLVDAARAQVPVVDLVERSSTRSTAGVAAYFAPAMGVFFVWFVAALGARSMVAEREQGTLARLLAAPVGRREVLGGKALATFLLCAGTMSVFVVVSSVLLRTWWGPPVAVLLLVLSMSFAVTGVTACVLSLATTGRQAQLWMSLATFAAALLGGNFLSLANAPQWLQAVSLLTPNGWALRGFSALADGGGLPDAIGPALALLAFGAVTSAVALARMDRLAST